MLILSHSEEIPAQMGTGSDVPDNVEKDEEVDGGGSSHIDIVEDGNNDDYFVDGNDFV